MNEADVRRRNHWVNHIARHAHAKPDAVYLRFEGRSVTWSQLHQRVSAIAAAMSQRGVGAGHRVAIMMTNRPEFLETMFAVNALGAIAVPINFRLAPDEIAFILTDSGPASWSWTRRRARPRRTPGLWGGPGSASYRPALPTALTAISRRRTEGPSRLRSMCLRTAPP